MKRCSGSWVVCLVCVLATGCGSDDSSGSSSNGGTGGSGTGGAAGSSSSVTYSGKINEISASGSTPLEGVELCAESHPSIACATTGADGTYTWPGLPMNTEVLVRGKKADYVDSTTFTVTTDQDVTDYDGGIVSRASMNLVYGIAQTTYDATKSSIAAYVVTPTVNDAGPHLAGVEGATLTITPASGKGPIYSSATGLPDPAATQTAKNGVALWAAVDVGDVTVTATAPGKTCKLGKYGWPSSDGTAHGTLSADTASFFQAICE